MIVPGKLIDLSYAIDYELIAQSAEEAKSFAEPYTDYRLKSPLEKWLISRYSNDYVEKVISDLGVNGQPRFYWLSKDFRLPEHIDNGTKCSINFILSDQCSPVTIEGVDYTYKSALLNTTIPHGVNNQDYERVLFKISIFDLSFEETAKLLTDKGFVKNVNI